MRRSEPQRGDYRGYAFTTPQGVQYCDATPPVGRDWLPVILHNKRMPLHGRDFESVEDAKAAVDREHPVVDLSRAELTALKNWDLEVRLYDLLQMIEGGGRFEPPHASRLPKPALVNCVLGLQLLLRDGG